MVQLKKEIGNLLFLNRAEFIPLGRTEKKVHFVKSSPCQKEPSISFLNPNIIFILRVKP